jgi:hypothetical protein
MKHLYVSAKVESRIAALKKAGKAGAVLAKKTTHIIENLTSGAVRNHMEVPVGYTKYGEKRIKNCRKYDLGCGFRLITLQRGEKVFIPFLGTHDECQRWLEKNSRLKKVVAGKGTLHKISCKPPPSAGPADAGIGDMQADAEEESLPELTDRDLRFVFRGLVDAVGKRT